MGIARSSADVYGWIGLVQLLMSRIVDRKTRE